MMAATGYTLPELQRVQALFSVGNTPLIELRNLTTLARKCAPAGKGARIFIKDEATNPSGSFKARRSCTSVYQAKSLVTRALSPQPAAITAQRLHAMPQWRDLNASLFRSATTAAE